MSGPQAPSLWRGLSEDQWGRSLSAPTIANLTALIEYFEPGQSTRIGKGARKFKWQMEAKACLDRVRPRLNNTQVRAALDACKGSRNLAYNPSASITNAHNQAPHMQSNPQSSAVNTGDGSRQFHSVSSTTQPSNVYSQRENRRASGIGSNSSAHLVNPEYGPIQSFPISRSTTKPEDFNASKATIYPEQAHPRPPRAHSSAATNPAQPSHQSHSVPSTAQPSDGYSFAATNQARPSSQSSTIPADDVNSGFRHASYLTLLGRKIRGKQIPSRAHILPEDRSRHIAGNPEVGSGDSLHRGSNTASALPHDRPRPNAEDLEFDLGNVPHQGPSRVPAPPQDRSRQFARDPELGSGYVLLPDPGRIPTSPQKNSHQLPGDSPTSRGLAAASTRIQQSAQSVTLVSPKNNGSQLLHNPSAPQPLADNSNPVTRQDPDPTIQNGGIIESDQVPISCIEEARRAIRSFLRTAYHQSWQLEPDFPHYLPVQPISGGQTIVSDAALQNLLGHVGSPRITSLQILSHITSTGLQNYEFSENGLFHPYRGRGPFWQNNSCALDCVIVAARLLSIGITVEDRGDASRSEWLKNLAPLERNFIGLTSVPWEGISNPDSVTVRDHFLDNYLNEFKKNNAQRPIKKGGFLSVLALWRLCTPSMRQFCFWTRKQTLCSKCNASTGAIPSLLNDVALPQLTDSVRARFGNRPTMSQLLNLNLSTIMRNCPAERCGGNKTRKVWSAISGDLPARLVVTPDSSYRDVENATSRRLGIEYHELGGRRNTAFYRWLGGIYNLNNHYRLYWTDCKPNDDSEKYMVYDGMKLGGSILGGVAPGNSNTKVPPYWCQGTDVLFYERIEQEPNIINLHRATIAINMETADFFKETLETEVVSHKKKRKRDVEKTVPNELEMLQDELGIAEIIAKYRRR